MLIHDNKEVIKFERLFHLILLSVADRFCHAFPLQRKCDLKYNQGISLINISYIYSNSFT